MKCKKSKNQNDTNDSYPRKTSLIGGKQLSPQKYISFIQCSKIKPKVLLIIEVIKLNQKPISF